MFTPLTFVYMMYNNNVCFIPIHLCSKRYMHNYLATDKQSDCHIHAVMSISKELFECTHYLHNLKFPKHEGASPVISNYNP